MLRTGLLTALTLSPCARRRMSAVLLSALCLALLIPPSAHGQPAPAAKRVILILCDDLTLPALLDDAELNHYIRHGAIGLMNGQTAGKRSPLSARFALALGDQQLPSPAEAENYNGRDKVAGEPGTAAQVYTRRTGRAVLKEPSVLCLGIADLARRLLADQTLGAALASADIPARIVSLYSPGSAQSAATFLAADADGRAVGRLAAEDGAQAPGALLRRIWPAPAGLTVVDLRLRAGRPLGAPTAPVSSPHAAIRAPRPTRPAGASLPPGLAGGPDRGAHPGRADAQLAPGRFLAGLLDELPSPVMEGYDVIVCSPYGPSAVPDLSWGRLTPIIAAGPDFPPGLLTSPTTRTTGLVANIDVAPTILSLFAAPAPQQMAGRPMGVIAGGSPADRNASLTSLDSISILNARAVTLVMEAVGAFGILVAVIGFMRLRRGLSTSRFAAVFVWGLNLPVALLLAPLLQPQTLLTYGLEIGLLMFGLAGLCLAIELPARTPAPVLACLLCVAAVCLDALTGQTLLKESLLSGYALSGIRYYGVGNEYLGVLVGMALMGGMAWMDAAPTPTAREEVGGGPVPPGGLPSPSAPLPEREGSGAAALSGGRPGGPDMTLQTPSEPNPRPASDVSPLPPSETTPHPASLEEMGWPWPARGGTTTARAAGLLPSRRILLVLVWSVIAVVLGWPSWGANAGSLIVTAVAFGGGALLLWGRRPRLPTYAGLALAGLLLSFLFAALDAVMSRGASSHAGEALRAAAGGRGIRYLAEIVARKLAMDLRLLTAPYELLGAAAVAVIILAAWLFIGRELRLTFQRNAWMRRGLPPLAAACIASLLFKDSGVVTDTFLVGGAACVALWHTLNGRMPGRRSMGFN